MLLYALLTFMPAHAGAIDDAQAMVLSEPQSAMAWVALGDAYRSAMKGKKARAAYTRASALEPDNLEVQARRADVGAGRASKLERRAMKSLQDDEIWGDLGDEYLAAGRTEDAQAAFEYAASIDPSDGEWQRKLAEMLGPEEMLAQIESGESTMGDEELGDLADILVGQGDTERACELYQRAAELDPSDNEWQEKLSNQCGISNTPFGTDYGYDGGMGGLIGAYDTIAEPAYGSESDDSPLMIVGQAYALMGRTEEAADFLSRALADAPTDERLRTAVMLMKGVTEVELLEGLVLYHSDEDELWGDLGDAYASAARPTDAANAWGRAAELDPEDEEWGYKLGLVDPDRAVSNPAADSIRELLENE